MSVPAQALSPHGVAEIHQRALICRCEPLTEPPCPLQPLGLPHSLCFALLDHGAATPPRAPQPMPIPP